MNVLEKISSIESAILENDGGFRDINFLEPTWGGIAAFFEKLEKRYSVRSSDDGVGNAMPEPLSTHIVKRAIESGWAHAVYENSSETISCLQVFVSTEEDGSAFIELSFFPKDVHPVKDLEDFLITWVENARSTLQPSQYFCRFANASWKFGDTNPGSGIIFTSVIK